MGDPYNYYELPDRELFIKLLNMAQERSQELFEILFFLRGAGTKLVESKQYGYVLRPIIKDILTMGWESEEEYKKESAALIPYRDLLVELLKEL